MNFIAKICWQTGICLFFLVKPQTKQREAAKAVVCTNIQFLLGLWFNFRINCIICKSGLSVVKCCCLSSKSLLLPFSTSSITNYWCTQSLCCPSLSVAFILRHAAAFSVIFLSFRSLCLPSLSLASLHGRLFRSSGLSEWPCPNDGYRPSWSFFRYTADHYFHQPSSTAALSLVLTLLLIEEQQCFYDYVERYAWNLWLPAVYETSSHTEIIILLLSS